MKKVRKFSAEYVVTLMIDNYSFFVLVLAVTLALGAVFSAIDPFGLQHGEFMSNILK